MIIQRLLAQHELIWSKEHLHYPTLLIKAQNPIVSATPASTCPPKRKKNPTQRVTSQSPISNPTTNTTWTQPSTPSYSVLEINNQVHKRHYQCLSSQTSNKSNNKSLSTNTKGKERNESNPTHTQPKPTGSASTTSIPQSKPTPPPSANNYTMC